MNGAPNSPKFKRLPLGMCLVVGMLGCTLPQAVAPTKYEEEGVVRAAPTARLVQNAGQIAGTVSASADVLALAGVSDFSSATATAYDPDGRVVAGPATVNGDGTFTMQGFKESRPRIFIEVNLAKINFRAVTEAPRNAKGEYVVKLDSGTTYLADRLHRAMVEQQVAFDRLPVSCPDDCVTIGGAADQVSSVMSLDDRNTVMTRGTMATVPGRNKMDLNGNLFDRFLELQKITATDGSDNFPLKDTMFKIAPGVLRGWKPSPIPPSPLIGVNPSAGPPIVPGGTPTPSQPPVK